MKNEGSAFLEAEKRSQIGLFGSKKTVSKVLKSCRVGLRKDDVDGDSPVLKLLKTHLVALAPDEIADMGKLAALVASYCISSRVHVRKA